MDESLKQRAAEVEAANAQRRAVEDQVRALHQRGEYERAAIEVLQFYRDQLIGWLIVRTDCVQRASDVYSEFLLRFWTQWRGFRWESSFRTWAFTILRRACWDARREARDLTSLPSELSQLFAVSEERLSTYKLSEVERNMRLLSEEILDEEERDILTLRVGQAMSWSEVALVLADGDQLDSDALQRRAASLRQRFKRIKTNLRQVAEERGMVRGLP
jgi:RNA polymerase sigma-70 factor (ECF subfamily)